MANEETKDAEARIAVRCEQCRRILAFKLGTTSGYLQLKCPYCKREFRVNLSLRKGRIYNRKSDIPFMIAFV